MHSIGNFLKNKADVLIWVVILIYIACFSYTCFLKYASYGYQDFDLASDTVVYHNTLNGKILHYPFTGGNIFGLHLYLILFLILPFYAIFPSALTVIFLQCIVLGLSAFPLYLLSKDTLGKTAALIVGVVYLLHPGLGYGNLFETHFDSFAVLFLFFAFYFFEKERFKKFLVFVLLAIMCKENVSMLVFMIGIYAAIRRRSLKWVLTPALLGAVWFFVAVKVLIPYFSADADLYPGGFMFTKHYLHLGSSILEMLKTVILNPIYSLKYAFTEKKILYLLNVFLPVGFLSFFSPAALLINLPIFMQNLLSSGPTHANIRFHYTLLILPFLFVSFVFALKKIINLKVFSRYKGRILASVLLVALYCNISIGPQSKLLGAMRAYRFYMIDDFTKTRNRLVKMIPKDASVMASFNFLPKLATRDNLYSIHFLSKGYKMYSNKEYAPPQGIEYVLVDFNDLLLMRQFFTGESAENIRKFLERGDFELVSAVDDVALFKKGHQNADKLTIQNAKFRGNIRVRANINNQLEFVGVDIKDFQVSPGSVLHIAHYWKKIGPVESGTHVSFVLIDKQGQPVLIKLHNLGYRIFPPGDWPKNSTVGENSWLLIPSNIKAGKYSLRAEVVSVSQKAILPIVGVKGSAKLDDFGRVIISDINIPSDL